MITCTRLKAEFKTPATCIERQRIIQDGEKRIKKTGRPLNGLLGMKYEEYNCQCGGCETGLDLFSKATGKKIPKKKEKKAVAENKRCVKCGDEFPATHDYFYKQSAAQDGLHPYCKACHNPGKHHEKLEKLRTGAEVSLDFSRHMDTLEKIKNLADEEMRTVENQIIYNLKNNTAA